MKKVIKLETADGKIVKVMLDNWGCGMDRLHRRWMLQPEGWQCVDTGAVARSLHSLTSHPMRLLHSSRH
jgi:hypothetical protein